MGDASISCSGPAEGPYAVAISWPFSDGVAETAHGSFPAYGNYTLAGNRQDSFYFSIGPPGAFEGGSASCVILSISSPL